MVICNDNDDFSYSFMSNFRTFLRTSVYIFLDLPAGWLYLVVFSVN